MKMRAFQMQYLSLTAYLKRQLEELASKPTMAEWLGRIERRSGGPRPTTEEIVQTIREARDADDPREWG